MNEKINFLEFVGLLAEEREITKKESEAFLRELFAVVAENILKDGNVKIKDLGTFKVTQVSARESVNVQTGTRVTIAPHKKVSFSPDKKLSELINAPFAHLEIIELDNPSTVKTEEKGEVGKANSTIVETIPKEQPEVKQIDKRPEELTLPVKEVRVDSHKSFIARHPGFIAISSFFLLAAFVGFTYVFIIKSSTREYISILKEAADQATHKSQESVVDTIISYRNVASHKNAETREEKDSVDRQVPAIPSEKTITIERGERLTLISLREYGDKAFWVYLYLANKEVIDDPNNVSPGTVIKIPRPETYDIDKNNPQSILKATTVMQKILNSGVK